MTRIGVEISARMAGRTNDDMMTSGLERWQDLMKVLEAKIDELRTHWAKRASYKLSRISVSPDRPRSAI